MVTIKEVKTKAEQKKFCDYPNVLYRDCPQYIPPLLSDELSDWDRRQNPAFEYCDAKCFLAYRDGKIVGRIGAILSRRANEKWGTKRMRFTQVDFIDDEEVVNALFAAVENYARECGMTQVHGPLGFCDLDREGMLVEGYGERSMFITYYNYPYYNEHLARLGYVKDVDWVEHIIDVPYDAETTAHFAKLSDYVLRQQGLHIAKVKHTSEYKKYFKKVFNLLNVAYAELYGTVELSARQIEKYCGKFAPLVVPEMLCLLMDGNNDLAGFGIAAPSLAAAFKKHRGRLFPFGFIDVLRALKKNTAMDMFLIALSPKYQNTGTNAVLLFHVMQGCQALGIKVAETGPQLETNSKVQSQWKHFNARQHKRRRCYIKTLS